jgi:hypothetical protein
MPIFLWLPPYRSRYFIAGQRFLLQKFFGSLVK